MYRYRDGQHPSSAASPLFAPFLAGRKLSGGELPVRNQSPASRPRGIGWKQALLQLAHSRRHSSLEFLRAIGVPAA